MQGVRKATTSGEELRDSLFVRIVEGDLEPELERAVIDTRSDVADGTDDAKAHCGRPDALDFERNLVLHPDI
jgi:hypothetical protein